MSENNAGESVSNANGESVEAGNQEQTLSEVDSVVVDRSPEELARKLKAYANENEKRRHAEKALKKQLEDAQAKLKGSEEQKLKEQGEWQKAYESAKQELSEVTDKLKKVHTSFAYKTVTSQIKEYATKNGCIDSESMIKLAAANGLLDSVEPDEEFNLPSETVKGIVTAAQKQFHFLFGKAAPTIRDGQPQTKPDTKVSLDTVPLKDRTRQLAEMLVKQRQ